MIPAEHAGFRFAPEIFEKLQAEAASQGVSLRAVVYRRLHIMLRHWPEGSYNLTRGNKKKLVMEVSQHLPRLEQIAQQLGVGMGALGDVIATFRPK